MSDRGRTYEFDFLRATEMAALNSHSWMGKGEKEMADAAACDAIRGMFDLMDIKGEVVIGEGIKDEAPGLFTGEKVGTWADGSPDFHIALDPVDGTTNLAKGMPNSIACIAAAMPCESGQEALMDIPAFYMNKIAYPAVVRDAWIKDPSLPISPDAPIDEFLKASAKLIGKPVKDLVIMCLDRPRNEYIVEAIRSCDAKLRLFKDGDIAAALAPALPGTNVDLFMGIGGAPEAVLAAAGMRCLNGGMQAKIWTNDEERKELHEAGWTDERIDKVYRSKDMAAGKNIVFAVTGISDNPLCEGVNFDGSYARTHSVLMRSNTKTIRHISTEHNLAVKTMNLRSAEGEVRLRD